MYLEAIVPSLNLLHHLEASQILHSLLPHEMDSSLVAQLFIENKVRNMKIGLDKEINVRSALSPSQ